MSIRQVRAFSRSSWGSQPQFCNRETLPYFQATLRVGAYGGEGQKPEFERALIRQRTEGLRNARKRGVLFGRPKKMRSDQQQLAQAPLKQDHSISEIARTFTVYPATLYRIRDHQTPDLRLAS